MVFGGVRAEIIFYSTIRFVSSIRNSYLKCINMIHAYDFPSAFSVLRKLWCALWFVHDMHAKPHYI